MNASQHGHCEHGYELLDGLGNGCLTCHQDEVDRLWSVIDEAFAALTDRELEAGIARARAGVALQNALIEHPSGEYARQADDA